MTLIQKFAKAIKIHEGWFPPGPKYPRGSLSYQNNNPGNFRAHQSQISTNQGFAVFKNYEDGWNALVDLIARSAAGKSPIYKPEMTILRFFQTYAPSADNNNPLNYAKFVANYIGKDINFKIKNLIMEQIILRNPVEGAILKRWPDGHIVQGFGENYYFYNQYSNTNGHDGIDIKGKPRTPVLAAHDGTVLSIGDNRQGKYLVLVGIEKKSNSYFRTIYGHFDEIIVKEEQEVKAGEKIGYLGNTGMAYEENSIFKAQLNAIWKSAPLDNGYHLHFSLKFFDNASKAKNYDNGFYGAIDPMPYFEEFNQSKQNDMSNTKLIKVTKKDGTSEIGFYLPATKPDALKAMAMNYGITIPLLPNGTINWPMLEQEIDYKINL